MYVNLMFVNEYFMCVNLDILNKSMFVLLRNES